MVEKLKLNESGPLINKDLDLLSKILPSDQFDIVASLDPDLQRETVASFNDLIEEYKRNKEPQDLQKEIIINNGKKEQNKKLKVVNELNTHADQVDKFAEKVESGEAASEDYQKAMPHVNAVLKKADNTELKLSQVATLETGDQNAAPVAEAIKVSDITDREIEQIKFVEAAKGVLVSTIIKENASLAGQTVFLNAMEDPSVALPFLQEMARVMTLDDYRDERNMLNVDLIGGLKQIARTLAQRADHLGMSIAQLLTSEGSPYRIFTRDGGRLLAGTQGGHSLAKGLQNLLGGKASIDDGDYLTQQNNGSEARRATLVA
jgi:hypothetical protein